MLSNEQLVASLRFLEKNRIALGQFQDLRPDVNFNVGSRAAKTEEAIALIRRLMDLQVFVEI